MRDDLDPINLSVIANDQAAAQDKPQVKLAKWATLTRDFVLLVPNALTHGDPANTVPLPALAVNFQEGDTQTRRTVGIAKLDMATRMIEYFVVERLLKHYYPTVYIFTNSDGRSTRFFARQMLDTRDRLAPCSEPATTAPHTP